MKRLKYTIVAALLTMAMPACTEKELDNINKNLNDPTNAPAVNELPSVIVESSFGTTGTDLAWYSSLFVEHSAGGDEQFYDADRRTGTNASSLVNNSWNSVYDNLMILNDIIVKCSPGGAESDKPALLGIAQILTAYNLAIATDLWGQVPWTEALKGQENSHPVYDKQQYIYQNVLFSLLNSAIGNLTGAKTITGLATNDLMYSGDLSLWIKAAWSLKARYFMHMQKVTPSAMDSVLACVPHGFESGDDALVFTKYENTTIGANPWWDFTYYERGDLVISETLYNLMTARNDPRIDSYFEPPTGATDNVAAPSGEADRTRAGLEFYSYSRITGLEDGSTAPTPLMSYHELKFIEAEALARKGQSFTAALQEAVEASFTFHGTSGGTAYYTGTVAPLLGTTLDANLKEILTQKYIAFYEAESIEAYNDYRRTRIVSLNNPFNASATAGFVERFPYATSETSSNSANIPSGVNVYTSKVWWAGGTE
ncbi:Starch-binding associating with outer membrane [Filimonas lacunae]|uniref:Starch-binding associating with outer membrane n=1 Tax=Filimonas lacunae TaxID=477680 RepID=A0A173MMM5_9BACT|nr:SusD/RagB family nutrient-binding outer membrane lipoprotein [Filimonas lacunae]BAV08737.1 hypothetical protein FLA_4784 [Filimonas lacunae]SIS60878.1 Starch-binding associating with outer membrane [Filimonas lacunae]